RRAELYAQAENLLYGPDGEFPLIPLFLRIDYHLRQPWLDGPFATDGTFGGPHYDWYTVDVGARAAAAGD
ncbi:MAG: hypothetical protein GYB65_22315, partial [Chloroflexi bacterium]|nr:hypothetical protein [Chloroflexota bacterium]